jgi:plastocyanin
MDSKLDQRVVGARPARSLRVLEALKGARAVRLLLAFGTVSAVIAAPAVAQAKTVTVYTGPPPNIAKLVPPSQQMSKSFQAKYNPDVNAFFPQKVTIHVGDTVSFIRGMMPHTIDIPPVGGSDLPLLVPGKGLVTGVNDAAGNPFWFNGKVPSLSLNPLLLPTGPTTVTYDGTTRVESGFIPPGHGTAPPFNVTFTKAGVFKALCDIHYGMAGTVVVLPKSKPLPTAAQDNAALRSQVLTDVKALKAAATIKPPANTVSVGSAGPGGAEDFAMFPATLRVKAGTVVTFSMSRDTREVHTVTFGSPSYLTKLTNGLLSDPVLTQQGLYPSDLPALGPIVVSPPAHGNGFANLGGLDRDSTTPLPASGKMVFPTPGVYHYACLIHPFMRGTIIVH